MFKNFKKRHLLGMFRTDSEITGVAWLEHFLLLAGEANEYITRFISAAYDLAELGREVESKASVLKTLDTIELGSGLVEEAKPVVAKERETLARMEEELNQRKGEALPASKEAVEKLPPILSKIENLPELKSERARGAKNVWDGGLRSIIMACESYISWCETEEIGDLYLVKEKIMRYLSSCTTRELYLDCLSPVGRDSVEKMFGLETLMELIQPLLKEGVVSHIPK